MVVLGLMPRENTLRLKVDTREVLAAFVALPSEYKKKMRVSLGNAMVRVQNKASKTHRYKTRSGNAAKSMSVDIAKDGLTGAVSITNNPAPYARRLHEGGGGLSDKLGRKMTNRPDPYLYNAFDREEAKIIKAFDDGISDAIKAAGF